MTNTIECISRMKAMTFMQVMMAYFGFGMQI